MAKVPKVSIVVRTLNEADPLRELLVSLARQKGVLKEEIELIVVDNESTDGTSEVVKEFGAKLLIIKKDEFSYPKSMNMGVAVATAPVVILTVGHSLPINKKWIISILPHFDDPKVAGVYGSVLPNKKYGIFEWLAYNIGYFFQTLENPRYISRVETGVFGATNCALRKSLWEEHSFDERFELGGEDGEWAGWAFSKNYIIVQEKGFTVRHSHGLSLIGYIAQLRYWRKLSRPTKFSRDNLSYRKDIKW